MPPAIATSRGRQCDGLELVLGEGSPQEVCLTSLLYAGAGKIETDNKNLFPFLL